MIGFGIAISMALMIFGVYSVNQPSRIDKLIQQADEVIADSNENKKQDSVTVLINGEWKSINFKNHTITDALPPDTQEEANSVEVLNHNYEADKFSPPPYKNYEEYVAHLRLMNFPDSLIDTREEYINKYPEHMTYDEYVQAMMRFNLRVRTKEEFEKMFNKNPEQESKPKKPMLGMTGTDKDGHEWMMYWDQVNFPIEQVRVVNGTTLEVVDKNGEHGFYLKLDLFTHHLNDWVSKLVIESQIKSGHYKQVYAKIIHTFPDGNRICSIHLVIDEESGKDYKQYLDLDKQLLESNCAFKNQEDADKHYELNKGKGPLFEKLPPETQEMIK